MTSAGIVPTISGGTDPITIGRELEVAFMITPDQIIANPVLCPCGEDSCGAGTNYSINGNPYGALMSSTTFVLNPVPTQLTTSVTVLIPVTVRYIQADPPDNKDTSTIQLQKFNRFLIPSLSQRYRGINPLALQVLANPTAVVTTGTPYYPPILAAATAAGFNPATNPSPNVNSLYQTGASYVNNSNNVAARASGAATVAASGGNFQAAATVQPTTIYPPVQQVSTYPVQQSYPIQQTYPPQQNPPPQTYPTQQIPQQTYTTQTYTTQQNPPQTYPTQQIPQQTYTTQTYTTQQVPQQSNPQYAAAVNARNQLRNRNNPGVQSTTQTTVTQTPTVTQTTVTQAPPPMTQAQAAQQAQVLTNQVNTDITNLNTATGSNLSYNPYAAQTAAAIASLTPAPLSPAIDTVNGVTCSKCNPTFMPLQYPSIYILSRFDENTLRMNVQIVLYINKYTAYRQDVYLCVTSLIEPTVNVQALIPGLSPDARINALACSAEVSELVVPSDAEVFGAYVIWLYSYISFVGATKWTVSRTPWVNVLGFSFTSFEFHDPKTGEYNVDYFIRPDMLMFADVALEQVYQVIAI